MRDSKQLLKAAVRRLGSQRKVARAVGERSNFTSDIKAGRRLFSESHAPELAAILGEPVGMVLAELRGERAKRTDVRRAWSDLAATIKRSAAAGMAGFFLCAFPANDARADQGAQLPGIH